MRRRGCHGEEGEGSRRSARPSPARQGGSGCLIQVARALSVCEGRPCPLFPSLSHPNRSHFGGTATALSRRCRPVPVPLVSGSTMQHATQQRRRRPICRVTGWRVCGRCSTTGPSPRASDRSYASQQHQSHPLTKTLGKLGRNVIQRQSLQSDAGGRGPGSRGDLPSARRGSAM